SAVMQCLMRGVRDVRIGKIDAEMNARVRDFCGHEYLPDAIVRNDIATIEKLSLYVVAHIDAHIFPRLEGNCCRILYEFGVAGVWIIQRRTPTGSSIPSAFCTPAAFRAARATPPTASRRGWRG